ncbi:hypothetical protein BKH05_05820 [Actinomyces naeslundii]|uniref:hypothetical protein n=1 Tax=Actinomyces naeslundii TaxID=1655 RepID=UPI00097B43C1|nr:hypothetical protein [Actinomyces naeslundii]OMG22022.1 hypothetical protein BKH05_05820 [Actinomyces naeslundii]
MSAAARSLAAIWQSFRLAVSQERVWLMALPVVTGLMTALLAPGYGDTYASPEDLARAVASAQVSDTSRFLYGDLSASAGIVQVAAWELGGLTCLVLGVVIALRSISLTRAAEDLGRTELLRSTGTGPAAGLVGQGLTLALLCLFLGIGAGAGLLALEEADGTDAVTYGAVLTATCLTVSFAALVLAQLAPDAPAGRSIALGVVGLMYSGNGMSASKDWDWAGWVSPFRLRTAVDPGGENSWGPVLIAVAASIMVLALAGALTSHRDLGQGLVQLPARRSPSLRAGGPLTLAVRLSRSQCLAWAFLVSLVAGVLVSMGGEVVDLARQGGISGGSLGSLLAGDDPGEAFLRYIGQLAGALAAAQGVSLALRYSSDERSGRLEMVVSTGNRPLRILLSSWLVAALGSGLTLICATVAAGYVGRSELDTDLIDAVRLVAGQWPAALASAAIATALCGAWPRGRGLAWAPVLVGLGIAQLGGVLDLPKRIRDAGLLAQAGENGSLWLLAITTAGLLIAAYCVTRRDMHLIASSRHSIARFTAF